ncbi:MAG: hypothetical protein ACI8XZ_004723 [Gammaproteobacteria bacterium]|jgi:hypothetical protein
MFKIDHRPSTIDHRPSTIDHRPSTIDHRPSTIDHRPSTEIDNMIERCLAGGLFELSGNH